MKKYDVKSKVNKYLEAFGEFSIFIKGEPMKFLKEDIHELKFDNNEMYIYFKANSFKYPCDYMIPYDIMDKIK